MKLEFIALDKLCVSKTNMRYAKKAPDVSDILPTVRRRGVLQPVIVRPHACTGEPTDEAGGRYEILAGSRRFHAAQIVAAERVNAAATPDPDDLLLPCAILEAGDDAAAIEASMIENMARQDADEVSQWESFTRLVKEGRGIEDISATFGLPEQSVKRILALGNLLPRIRDLYRKDAIDAVTVRRLTMASKSQQKAWLALADDDNSYLPTGHQLKAWLFGGQSIPTRHALFALESYGGEIVTDLFGEGGYFADADAFWAAQNAGIEVRRAAYIEAGWADVIIVPPSEHFSTWEYEKAPKRKGGRVYIDVRANGEVIVHEGYVSRREAARIAKGEGVQSGEKPARPELTGPLQTYIDLHRHAALRATLLGHGGVALRLMVAHAIIGSPLWTVRAEPQAARSDAIAESIEDCAAEAAFDVQRRAILAVLGMAAEEPTVAGGNGDDHDLGALFLRLLDLPDSVILEVIAIVMGETLVAGSAVIETVGLHIGVDMARWWQADDAFFELLRDRETLGRIVAEVAGDDIAAANATEKAKTLKSIVRDHIDGSNGREKRAGWVPRWMRFAPSAYTARGGVGTVNAHARIIGLGSNSDGPDPDAPGSADALPEHENMIDPMRRAA